MSLSLAQLSALAASIGFPDPALAAAVAMAESGGDPNAYGDAQYGGSIGLWQINLPAHPDYTEDELYDPETNARAAYAISSHGTNWNPWTTYRTGAYKRWYKGASSSSASGLPLVPLAVLATSVALVGAALEWWKLPGAAALQRYARRAWNA